MLVREEDGGGGGGGRGGGNGGLRIRGRGWRIGREEIVNVDMRLVGGFGRRHC